MSTISAAIADLLHFRQLIASSASFAIPAVTDHHQGRGIGFDGARGVRGTPKRAQIIGAPIASTDTMKHGETGHVAEDGFIVVGSEDRLPRK